MQNPLFFIALLPDPEIQQVVTAFKKECAQLFQASHSLKTPPHITVKAPFRWPSEKFDMVKEALLGFGEVQSPFGVHLDNFGSFPPRVIYVNVLPNESLNEMKKALDKCLLLKTGLKTKHRGAFRPHITIAHRDLREEAFLAAWEHFSKKSFNGKFEAKEIVLFQHLNGKWEVEERFAFKQ